MQISGKQGCAVQICGILSKSICQASQKHFAGAKSVNGSIHEADLFGSTSELEQVYPAESEENPATTRTIRATTRFQAKG